jgi:hypothetical protein
MDAPRLTASVRKAGKDSGRQKTDNKVRLEAVVIS